MSPLFHIYAGVTDDDVHLEINMASPIFHIYAGVTDDDVHLENAPNWKCSQRHGDLKYHYGDLVDASSGCTCKCSLTGRLAGAVS